jgi:hypothetical protein
MSAAYSGSRAISHCSLTLQIGDFPGTYRNLSGSILTRSSFLGQMTSKTNSFSIAAKFSSKFVR